MSIVGHVPAPQDIGDHAGIDPASAPPPTLHDPATGPLQLLNGLWNTYGPTIVATGISAAQQVTARGANAASGLRQPPVEPQRRSSDQSVLARRRQLEAELANLPRIEDEVSGASEPPSPESDLSNGHNNHNQFEEIEVPSDIEGYDATMMTPPRSGGTRATAVNRRTSWFGWAAPEGHDNFKEE